MRSPVTERRSTDAYRPIVVKPHTASHATATVTAAPNAVSQRGLR